MSADPLPEVLFQGRYRLTNFEFEELLLGTLGIGSTKKLFDANWFILRNFHGQWYACLLYTSLR